MTIQRQTANKSPFKAVYPLINADNLMIIICTVVKEICVIVVSNLKNNGHKIAKNCYFRFAVPCSSETGKTQFILTRIHEGGIAILSSEVDFKNLFVSFHKIKHLFYSANTRTFSVPFTMQYLSLQLRTPKPKIRPAPFLKSFTSHLVSPPLFCYCPWLLLSGATEERS